MVMDKYDSTGNNRRKIIRSWGLSSFYGSMGWTCFMNKDRLRIAHSETTYRIWPLPVFESRLSFQWAPEQRPIKYYDGRHTDDRGRR